MGQNDCLRIKDFIGNFSYIRDPQAFRVQSLNKWALKLDCLPAIEALFTQFPVPALTWIFLVTYPPPVSTGGGLIKLQDFFFLPGGVLLVLAVTRGVFRFLMQDLLLAGERTF